MATTPEECQSPKVSNTWRTLGAGHFDLIALSENRMTPTLARTGVTHSSGLKKKKRDGGAQSTRHDPSKSRRSSFPRNVWGTTLRGKASPLGRFLGQREKRGARKKGYCCRVVVLYAGGVGIKEEVGERDGEYPGPSKVPPKQGDRKKEAEDPRPTPPPPQNPPPPQKAKQIRRHRPPAPNTKTRDGTTPPQK